MIVDLLEKLLTALDKETEASRQRYRAFLRGSNLHERLRQGEDVDSIAEEYVRKGIPPRETFLFACSLVGSEWGQEVKRRRLLPRSISPPWYVDSTFAERLNQIERVQSGLRLPKPVPEPSAFLNSLHSLRTVLALQEVVAGSPESGPPKWSGLLILTRPYLYFSPISLSGLVEAGADHKEFRYSMYRMEQLADDYIPGFGIAKGVVDFFKMMGRVNEDFFNEKRRFVLRHSVATRAIPLEQITSLQFLKSQKTGFWTFFVQWKGGVIGFGTVDGDDRERLRWCRSILRKVELAVLASSGCVTEYIEDARGRGGGLHVKIDPKNRLLAGVAGAEQWR